MSNLTAIINKIEKIPYEAEEACYTAIGSFKAPFVPEDYNDFINLIANFFCSLQNKYFRINRSPDTTHDWGQVRDVLLKSYGPSGDKVAFHMAITGTNGGLRAVLNVLSTGTAKQFAKQGIKAIVNNYWHSLSADEKIAAGKEYCEKYGHLLPSELMEVNAVRARMHLPDVLAIHPFVLQETRKVGR